MPKKNGTKETKALKLSPGEKRVVRGLYEFHHRQWVGYVVIADKLGMRMGNCTKTLEPLKTNGLIETDAEKAAVRLTPTARKLVKASTL